MLADWAAIAIENAPCTADVRERRDELERAVAGSRPPRRSPRAAAARPTSSACSSWSSSAGARWSTPARPSSCCCWTGDRLVAAAAGEGGPETASALAPDRRLARRRRSCTRARPSASTTCSARSAWPTGAVGAETAPLVPLVYRGRRSACSCVFDRLDGRRLRRRGRAPAPGVRGQRRDRGRDGADGRRGAPRRARCGRAGAQPLGARAARRDAAGARRAAGAAERAARGRRRRRRSSGGDARRSSRSHAEIANLRALITELRPAALDELGLEAAIEGLGSRRRTSRRAGGRARGRSSPTARLDRELETAVYRLVQEALTNVGKHARADRVSVRVELDYEALRVEIRDDGLGFDTGSSADGFGLLGMRERVTSAGEVFDVTSQPGETVIRATPPAP